MFENNNLLNSELLESLELSLNGNSYFIEWINDNSHTATTKLYAEFLTSPTKYTLLQTDILETDSTSLALKVYNVYDPVTNVTLLPITPIRIGAPFTDFIPSGATVNTTTAPATVGTALNSTFVFSSGQGNTGGTANSNAFIRILPPNTNFILELDNRDNSTRTSKLEIRWAEVENLPKAKVQ